MTTASTRRVRVRKMATLMALAPPVVTMTAGCTHWRHRHPDGPDRPGGTGTRPTRPPTTAPSTTRPITTVVPPPTTPPTTVATTVTTRPPTTARPTTVTTAKPTTTAATPKTATGNPGVQQYGSITVTVTVLGNRITNVTATAGVTDPVSVLINNDAIPKLNAAVMAAQSANIAGVSGATLTSPAYKQSLQSALDKAGFRA